MRSLSEIRSEKEWVTTNLRKAGMWCAGGLVTTILSLLVASHLGFSIITLGAIGWGGWNVYKCLKRLKELKDEEEWVMSHEHSVSHAPISKPSAKALTSSTPLSSSPKLRSKTWR